MSIRLYLSDERRFDMSNASTLKALDPNPRIYFVGRRTQIMRWLYQHMNLPIRNELGDVQVMICNSAQSFGHEYSKAVATGFLPGVGVATRAADAAGTASTLRMRGSPGRARRVADRVFGSDKWVMLDAGGNLHPNPHARQELLSTPCKVTELITLLENMDW